MSYVDILKQRIAEPHLGRLLAIQNEKLHLFVAETIELCDPKDVFVSTDSTEDIVRFRAWAVEKGEEKALAIPGHTVHFDGYADQARDKDYTRILLTGATPLGSDINVMEKEEGTKEVRGILKGMMTGSTMIVRFFCLGPVNSEFTILSCQLTDSPYVAHSLDLLYRQGYEEFKRQGVSSRFFRIMHSQGELENGVSKHVALRRIYIDPEDEIVYSTNTQYGGNSLGLKKLSMRLAIKRASEEDWLCEHMFVMGVHGPNNRITYFTGAFPSLCGKTSTSMITGESIVGDDIAYLRKKNGEVRAVNVEKGMFGIIMGINSKDDPIIWKTLNNPGEVIFSNVLVTPDQSVYWIDKEGPVPEFGVNHSGGWKPGKTDAKGKKVDPSHKNARFTIDLASLENVDSKLHDPNGVSVAGMIYGGRDSSAWVPVRQSFDWTHGIATIAAALESETTAATLGKEGVPEFNPMSNIDFLSIPMGKYIQSNLEFGKGLVKAPAIFGVNYFLKDREGKFLNTKTDKAIWLKWMELRTHGDVEVIKTPVGFIPRYEDLLKIFKTLQNKDFSEQNYIQQFSIRTKEFLAKIKRIHDIYRTSVPDAPADLFKALEAEIDRLREAESKLGETISPERFV